MIDVREYAASESLKDGRNVCVRAIRPEDKTTLLESFSRFSEASVYKRFHGSKRHLTDEELKFYTEIDYLHHMALVASLDENDQIVGGGRYIAHDTSQPPRSAEIAFAVADNFQGLGVGTIMLKHLIIIARDVGIGTFEADVLAENSAMIRVFKKSGLLMSKDHEGQNVHITLNL